MTNTQTLMISAPIVIFAALVVWGTVIVPHRKASVKRMRDPARGTFLVTGVSAPGEDMAVWISGTVTGVVTIPGRDPFAHKHEGLLRGSKYPKPGAVLPIVIDRADSSRLAIQWDEISKSADTAFAEARRLAGEMRADD